MLLTEQTAREMIAALPGEIGFWAEDTVTGEVIRIGEETPIEAASVIKLLVMAEAFRQREEEGLDFGQLISIRDEDRLPSCGAITYLHRDIQLPVRDLVVLMIILSDNTATNLLIDLLGMDKIRALAINLGLDGLVLRRKLFQP